MSITQLNQHNIKSIAARLACPTYERNAVKAGIIHIGLLYPFAPLLRSLKKSFFYF